MRTRLLFALIWARSHGSTELVYDVTGHFEVRSNGRHTMHMTVTISPVLADGDGHQTKQLTIDRTVRIVDEHGSAHWYSADELQLPDHPFYFRQAANGEILDVLHHMDDPSQSVGAKKALAAAHQFIQPAQIAPHWATVEIDAVGQSDASYHLQGDEIATESSSDLVRSGMVVQKSAIYRTSSAVPRGFSYVRNATATLLPNGTVTLLQEWTQFHADDAPLRRHFGAPASAAQSDEGLDGGAPRLDGLGMIPQGVRTTTWLLRATRRPPPHPHQRALMEDDCLVRSSLMHEAERVPSVSEMRRERWQRAPDTLHAERGHEAAAVPEEEAGAAGSADGRTEPSGQCSERRLQPLLQCLFAPSDAASPPAWAPWQRKAAESMPESNDEPQNDDEPPPQPQPQQQHEKEPQSHQSAQNQQQWPERQRSSVRRRCIERIQRRADWCSLDHVASWLRRQLDGQRCRGAAVFHCGGVVNALALLQPDSLHEALATVLLRPGPPEWLPLEALTVLATQQHPSTEVLHVAATLANRTLLSIWPTEPASSPVAPSAGSDVDGMEEVGGEGAVRGGHEIRAPSDDDFLRSGRDRWRGHHWAAAETEPPVEALALDESSQRVLLAVSAVVGFHHDVGRQLGDLATARVDASRHARSIRTLVVRHLDQLMTLDDR